MSNLDYYIQLVEDLNDACHYETAKDIISLLNIIADLKKPKPTNKDKILLTQLKAMAEANPELRLPRCGCLADKFFHGLDPCQVVVDAVA